MSEVGSCKETSAEAVYTWRSCPTACIPTTGVDNESGRHSTHHSGTVRFVRQGSRRGQIIDTTAGVVYHRVAVSQRFSLGSSRTIKTSAGVGSTLSYVELA
jgi:hypothetical protein